MVLKVKEMKKVVVVMYSSAGYKIAEIKCEVKAYYEIGDKVVFEYENGRCVECNSSSTLVIEL